MARDEVKNVVPGEVIEQIAQAPNPRLDDFEDDVLTNEHMEQTEPSAPGQAPLARPATQDQMAQMMAAMLEIAKSLSSAEQRRESQRQLSITEIKPDSPWNPEGKRDRLKLSRATSLHGIALNPLTHSEEEIALFNKLKPGRYIERRVEVRMTQDGSIDLSWPGAKNDTRIEFYSRFPTLVSLLQAVIAERTEKEDRRRKGIFTDDDSLE